ncbi:1,2-dihydroxy-3-keto-5-methylthiopentene dioxygenase-like [Haliotis rubra]|uniref:1,2-dihydroxy-3-keto-5-methylthiopentene dioxygenase-like n=1 Tax=Haliotis rubra TaxID=36100 RepID=UPI001EE58438|nr:1,2-dihydroxy-3-keto-5-methylthiopentene dioxygenase-like [Haliotis rubra]XP_046583552.1 1,2-dihydroxy-3-keto-5-methylthiopentene dioxygenase-like [Haliotis rubra]
MTMKPISEPPHKLDPPQYLNIEELYQKTGVRYEKIPESVCDDNEAVERIPSERKYLFHDYMEMDRDTLKDYDKMMKVFYDEHLHEDPEIRLIVSGAGFFEVRSIDDRWVRIHVQKGDLLDLPPGIWHRFVLDDKDYIKMLRLFSETPSWEAEFRTKVENPPARDRYRKAMAAIA